jgi:dynein heavy chain, axonemal
VLQLKSNQPNATQLLQHAMQEGSIVLVEGAGEVTSESMLSIVRRELSRHAGALTIKFNDNQLELHANFMCYICSQYSNPHFTPEVHQLGKVLDFSVTREGLEQQLLQIVCKAESAKEEDEREKL